MFKKLRISQKFILSFIFITVGPLLTVSYLSYSNSKPVYGVYRLDSDALHGFFDTEDISASDVAQLIDQFAEPPDLDQLIEDYKKRLSS